MMYPVLVVDVSERERVYECVCGCRRVLTCVHARVLGLNEYIGRYMYLDDFGGCVFTEI